MNYELRIKKSPNGTLDWETLGRKFDSAPDIDSINTWLNYPTPQTVPTDYIGEKYLGFDSSVGSIFPGEGGSRSLTITVYGEWRLYSELAWIEVDGYITGTDHGVLTNRAIVRVLPNRVDLSRLGEIYLENIGTGEKVKYNIIQGELSNPQYFMEYLNTSSGGDDDACYGPFEDQYFFEVGTTWVGALAPYVYDRTTDTFSKSVRQGWLSDGSYYRKWHYDFMADVWSFTDEGPCGNSFEITFDQLPSGVNTLSEWITFLGVNISGFQEFGNRRVFFVSESVANAKTGLNWNNKSINNIEGLGNIFKNLTTFLAKNNNLTRFDIPSSDKITTIDLSNNPNFTLTEVLYTLERLENVVRPSSGVIDFDKIATDPNSIHSSVIDSEAFYKLLSRGWEINGQYLITIKVETTNPYKTLNPSQAPTGGNHSNFVDINLRLEIQGSYLAVIYAIPRTFTITDEVILEGDPDAINLIFEDNIPNLHKITVRHCIGFNKIKGMINLTDVNYLGWFSSPYDRTNGYVNDGVTSFEDPMQLKNAIASLKESPSLDTNNGTLQFFNSSVRTDDFLTGLDSIENKGWAIDGDHDWGDYNYPGYDVNGEFYSGLAIRLEGESGASVLCGKTRPQLENMSIPICIKYYQVPYNTGLQVIGGFYRIKGGPSTECYDGFDIPSWERVPLDSGWYAFPLPYNTQNTNPPGLNKETTVITNWLSDVVTGVNSFLKTSVGVECP